MFWLNVDNPTKMWKLHKESCRYGEPHDTSLKGIGKMKQDGGWFKFDSYGEAYKFYQKNGSNGIWQPCKFCNPE
jgi:hypothetical protein